ncbi:MAG: DUF3343 domain-containing protein [Nitrososphaerota archaeon]|nr:DUF3343 domain-containing protein [Nitrososphaerota archaeon]MDG6922242.1 DUF3343 domain-containing protein [Nitrososphaerota archaeon]
MAEKNQVDSSVFLFEHFRDGMKAEDILISNGFHTHAGAPPPDVRTGCDLAISLPVDEMIAGEKTLKEKGIKVYDVILKFTGNLPELQISKLVKTVDYGDYLMVRVGNMKLTFRKQDGTIVNISGGGCPDIPLLAVKMIGQKLQEIEPPAQIGYTLCAYSLQKAYEVALGQWRGTH